MINTSKYSQRDKNWALSYMGKTKRTIGQDGCVITSIANLLSTFEYSYTPQMVNNMLSARNGYSYVRDGAGRLYARVIWAKVSEIWPKLRFVERGPNYSNLKVSTYVYLKRLPVLVEVNASKIGGVRHWVLFVGDRKMVDAWDGKVKSTGTYFLTGYSLYDRK